MGNSLTCKVVICGPDDARKIRNACHFPRQRNIAPRNLRRLGAELVAGRFVDGTPVFFVRLPSGKLYIVNGNHTLESIAETGVYQRLVFIILDVPTEEEAERIYGVMDVHKVRSWADALRAVGLADEITGARRIMPALGVILGKFEYMGNSLETTSNRAIRFKLMEAYADESALFFGALSGAPLNNQRALQRAAVSAVALETLKYQPAKAVEFWRGAAQDDGLGKADPRKALLRWLGNNSVGTGTVTWPAQSRAAAHAWNAYHRGETLSVIRKSEAAAISIAGTPWQGKGKIPDLVKDLIAEAMPSAEASPVPIKGAGEVPASDAGEALDFGLFAGPAGADPSHVKI